MKYKGFVRKKLEFKIESECYQECSHVVHEIL